MSAKRVPLTDVEPGGSETPSGEPVRALVIALEEDIVLGRVEPRSWEWDIDNFALPPEGFDFDKLRKLESHLLRQALARTNNNQTQAARLLNLSRDRLRYRLQKHGLL